MPNPIELLPPEELDQLLKNSHLLPLSVQAELKYLKALQNIVTVDAKMNLVKDCIKKIHDRPEPVLILGETGTGKELIATALHGNRIGKLVKVNCSGLPDELIESELFGHTRGAFTGAIADRTGKMEYANNGTLFLDEIGDMPLNMQAKLLRALQDKKITPLGSNKETDINCRVVSATNKDLYEMRLSGKFRLDLLHRISTFKLKTTPFRDRKQDIHEVMDAILDKDGKIPPDVRDTIALKALHGNFRELESLCVNYIVYGKLEEDGEYLL